jgi:hypothetical protein
VTSVHRPWSESLRRERYGPTPRRPVAPPCFVHNARCRPRTDSGRAP